MFGQIFIGIFMLFLAIYTLINKKKYILDDKAFHFISADFKEKYINTLICSYTYYCFLFIIMAFIEKVIISLILYLILYIVLAAIPIIIIFNIKKK